jgi:hypothetical protein
MCRAVVEYRNLDAGWQPFALARLPNISVVTSGNLIRRTPMPLAREQNAYWQVGQPPSIAIEGTPELFRLVFGHERINQDNRVGGLCINTPDRSGPQLG